MEKSEITIAEYLQQINERQKSMEALLLSQKTVLNFDEAASYTSLSKSYLYKLTCSGGIPCYKPNGKHVYFSKTELDTWLLSNRKATTEEIETKASTYVTLKNGGGK
jgi:excisionase family DNA binding protein